MRTAPRAALTVPAPPPVAARRARRPRLAAKPVLLPPPRCVPPARAPARTSRPRRVLLRLRATAMMRVSLSICPTGYHVRIAWGALRVAAGSPRHSFAWMRWRVRAAQPRRDPSSAGRCRWRRWVVLSLRSRRPASWRWGSLARGSARRQTPRPLGGRVDRRRLAARTLRETAARERRHHPRSVSSNRPRAGDARHVAPTPAHTSHPAAHQLTPGQVTPHQPTPAHLHLHHPTRTYIGAQPTTYTYTAPQGPTGRGRTYTASHGPQRGRRRPGGGRSTRSGSRPPGAAPARQQAAHTGARARARTRTSASRPPRGGA